MSEHLRFIVVDVDLDGCSDEELAAEVAATLNIRDVTVYSDLDDLLKDKEEKLYQFAEA